MTCHAGGGGRSGGHTEDRARSADVSVHAGFAYSQEVRDLLRRKAARDRAQHLTLPIGQGGGTQRGASRENAPGKRVPGNYSDQRGSRVAHRQRERPRLAV
jgi:hypothetical protein